MVFGGRRQFSLGFQSCGSLPENSVAVMPMASTEMTAVRLDELAPNRFYKLFADHPEIHLLEESDPIVIDCCSMGNGQTHCGMEYRLHARSVSEQGSVSDMDAPQVHQSAGSKVCNFAGRRTWSDGALDLSSEVRKKPALLSTCPCESVQGIGSHGFCPQLETISETSCFTCGSDWAQDHTSLACFECGAFGMTRPCMRCHGKCGVVWKRDLKETHSTGEAKWIGECALEKENKLPQREQQPVKPEPGIQ